MKPPDDIAQPPSPVPLPRPPSEPPEPSDTLPPSPAAPESVWALPYEVFGFLRTHLQMGAVVVELGSGEGTALLVDMCGKVYSIEHDPRWVGHAKGANYIHAPIVDGWYSPTAIKAGLPDRIDCLIVDGPPGDIGRGGLLAHLEMFGTCPVVVDDVHRRPEFLLAASIAEHRNANLTVHHLKGGRAFATIGWGEV